jgi:hypothetical protein
LTGVPWLAGLTGDPCTSSSCVKRGFTVRRDPVDCPAALSDRPRGLAGAPGGVNIASLSNATGGSDRCRRRLVGRPGVGGSPMQVFGFSRAFYSHAASNQNTVPATESPSHGSQMIIVSGLPTSPCSSQGSRMAPTCMRYLTAPLLIDGLVVTGVATIACPSQGGHQCSTPIQVRAISNRFTMWYTSI